MKPSELDQLSILSEPRLHPRDDRAVFVVSRPNLEKDRYDKSLWITEAGDVREIPGGRHAGAPEWSPDGSKLACLIKISDDPDATDKDAEKHVQLAIFDRPEGGGAPRILTRYPLGVSKFEWSPNGDRIAVIAADHEEGWSKLDSKERGKKPRRLQGVPWRYDSDMTMDDRRPLVALIDPTGQRKPRALDVESSEIVGAADLAWHPSGDRVAVLAERYHRERRNRLEHVILEIELATGKVREHHRDGYWEQLLYAGERLVAMGVTGVYEWPNPMSLYEIPPGKDPVHLIPSLDRMVSIARPIGDSVFFLFEDQGLHRLGRWRGGSDVEPMVDELRHVTDFDVRPGGKDALLVASETTDPGELFRKSGGSIDRITSLNVDFRGDVRLAEPEHFTVDTGGVEVDTWVYFPEGGGRVPVLLNIHGGPATQYGFGFFDEFQVYVEAGYAVVACNPRGSSGRGAEHLRAVRKEAWGEVDRTDILACLDAALERFDRLDPERVGVMGGSYGGFMTAWLTGHTDRFKSAVVERGLLNWETFAGTSDIATIFPMMYFDVSADAVDLLRDKSPQRLADRVKTPTLVIHSEEDWRCPIEQADQYFAALLRHGTPAEFLRFPGESHELSRSGDPKHREARFKAIVEWHDKYLKA